MRPVSPIARVVLLIGVLSVAGPTLAQVPSTSQIPRPPAPPLARVADVCMAYDVTAPHPMGDSNDAILLAVANLIDTYGDLGVPAQRLDIHVVLRGEAVKMALTDAAYKRVTGTSTNPHEDDIAMLLHANASVEVCHNTMQRLGIEPKDLLPTVMVVPGAIVRLVDLQQRGCSYISF